jgi:TM2 domain-containing membrane protein YozV
MTNRNDEPGSRPNEESNDWSQQPDSGAPPEIQNSERGDIPKPVPPNEPEDWQAPGPQGPRESQGGEWDAGHTIEDEPGMEHPRAKTWQEGMGEEGEQRMQEPAMDQPPARRERKQPKLDNSDIFAIILSAIFPGVGQMMLGQQTKGIVVLLVAIVTGCGLGLLSLASALDTYCVAIATKKREVDEWEFFPGVREIF